MLTEPYDPVAMMKAGVLAVLTVAKGSMAAGTRLESAGVWVTCTFERQGVFEVGRPSSEDTSERKWFNDPTEAAQQFTIWWAERFAG